MPAGRPRKEIDRAEIEKLCLIHCTLQEISGWYGVSEDTIQRRIKDWGYSDFAAFFKTYSSDGKMSLRRAQFKKAVEENNVAMQIWLGKQMLDQKDVQHIDSNVTGQSWIKMSYNKNKGNKDGNPRKPTEKGPKAKGTTR